MCIHCWEDKVNSPDTSKYLTNEECESLLHHEMCMLVWPRRDGKTVEECLAAFARAKAASAHAAKMLNGIISRK
jgi:hypothetical protein